MLLHKNNDLFFHLYRISTRSVSVVGASVINTILKINSNLENFINLMDFVTTEERFKRMKIRVLFTWCCSNTNKN